jgi:cytochrome c-type biogenesis protein CcmH
MTMTRAIRWHQAGALALLALLALAQALALVPGSEAHAQVSNTEVRRIAGKLQCPVCEGTSVADSPSPVAEAMRDKVRTLLDEGRSEREIMAFFRSVYGDFVLRSPPTTGLASAVWWFPGVAIVAGFGLVYLLVWRRRRPQGASEAAEQPKELTEAELAHYRDRIRRALEDQGL